MKDTTKSNIYNIVKKYKDVLLVDLMNHLHRFQWVYQDLHTSCGDEIIYTGHIYGFLRFITFLKDRFPDCAIIVVRDGYDKDRRGVVQEYKSNRTHSHEMYRYVKDIVKFASMMDGVYVSYHPNFEADDSINVVSNFLHGLCERYKIKKNIYILSNDKDMYQLVKDSEIAPVHIIRKFGNGAKWMEEADVVDVTKVQETFEGVSPCDLVKFRSIVGDASDNLKGYYRFRKKDAAAIARNFDYDEENETFVIKEGLEKYKAFDKPLEKILKDVDIFKNNYKVMKMKTFDFDIDLIRLSKDEIVESVKEIKSLELNQYITNLCIKKYSKYRNEVVNVVSPAK